MVGVSAKIVKRDWSVAGAWLYEDLRVDHGNDARQMEKVKVLFEAALERPTEQRMAYLTAACAEKRMLGHKSSVCSRTCTMQEVFRTNRR